MLPFLQVAPVNASLQAKAELGKVGGAYLDLSNWTTPLAKAGYVLSEDQGLLHIQVESVIRSQA